jgi:uncharacterized protein
VRAAIALTIIYTWVFNNTRGSLLIVILAHAPNDAFLIHQLFSAPVVTNSLLPFVVGFGAAAVLFVILAQCRLGYDRYQQGKEAEAVALRAKGIPT